ncbi:hypothetical protein [Sporosalibacterium faouarense]|nr:hypothetical protein [Sporosalibacterium faouarense]
MLTTIITDEVVKKRILDAPKITSVFVGNSNSGVVFRFAMIA